VDDPDNFDINAKVGIAMLMPKILAEAGIKRTAVKGKAQMNDFVNLLFYNLKYRTYTPQSLELMIEALLCGCACCK
jgi:hypothetical protein